MKIRERFDDFKSFALKGNVLDLAIGVIIGGAFGAIVTSLVNDIIMPVLGLILGRINLATLSVTLRAADDVNKIKALTLNYGAFLQSIVNFLIIALSIYFFIKLIGSVRRKQEKKEEAVPLTPTKSEELLTEIRDLLKDKRS